MDVRNNMKQLIKRDEVWRLCAGMQVDLIKDIFDLEKHKVGQKINSKNQQPNSLVQSLMNLNDWVLKLSNIPDPLQYFKEPIKINEVRCRNEKFKLYIYTKRHG